MRHVASSRPVRLLTQDELDAIELDIEAVVALSKLTVQVNRLMIRALIAIRQVRKGAPLELEAVANHSDAHNLSMCDLLEGIGL